MSELLKEFFKDLKKRVDAWKEYEKTHLAPEPVRPKNICLELHEYLRRNDIVHSEYKRAQAELINLLYEKYGNARYPFNAPQAGYHAGKVDFMTEMRHKTFWDNPARYGFLCEMVKNA